MKKAIIFPAILLGSALMVQPLFGQGIFDRVQKRVERKVEQRATQKVENAVDDGLDTVDGKNSKSSSSKKSSSSSSSSNSGNSGSNSGSSGSSTSSKGGSSTSGSEHATVWSKYDFVQGEEIIIADDLNNEDAGEFPSRWDLVSGSAEIATFEKDNVVKFMGKDNEIKPLMSSANYLPRQFTVEFDAYFYNLTNEGYTLNLTGLDPITIHYNYAEMGSFNGTVSSKKQDEGWRHIALAFNTRSLKFYLDHDKVLNIPNIKDLPSALSVSAKSPLAGNNQPAMIKNFRVAEGGVKLYFRLRADGKIVTRGITFDSGSSNLKPESFGTLNEIAKMMEEHPEIKLSVEGHTDSDGSDESNLELSRQRADAVVAALTSMGIASKRLKSKGLGESSPVDASGTPEAKANNRRVEFVQF